jgi:hypothetical protein
MVVPQLPLEAAEDAPKSSTKSILKETFNKMKSNSMAASMDPNSHVK